MLKQRFKISRKIILRVPTKSRRILRWIWRLPRAGILRSLLPLNRIFCFRKIKVFYQSHISGKSYSGIELKGQRGSFMSNNYQKLLSAASSKWWTNAPAYRLLKIHSFLLGRMKSWLRVQEPQETVDDMSPFSLTPFSRLLEYYEQFTNVMT